MPPLVVPTRTEEVNTEGGFRAFYASTFPFVWRCLRAHGVAEAELEDAAQEVFVIAHRKLPEFRGDSSLRTWLYGILRHVAANQRRKQRRKRVHDELDPDTTSQAPGPEQSLQDRQRAEFVVRFAEKLDDKKRDVFVLSLVEQLSMPEVAEILGIPVDTAYTRLRSAREAFRKALGRTRESP